MKHVLHLQYSLLLALLFFEDGCIALPSAGNKTKPAVLDSNASSTLSLSPPSDSGGCIFSFTGPNTDIPVFTSGYTVLDPASKGGPPQTVPCGKFLAVARGYIQSTLLKGAQSSRHNLSTSAIGNFTTSAPSTLTIPTFTDLNLTGCYAGTGGTTTFTISSGDQVLSEGSDTMVYRTGTRNGQAITWACSDFMTQASVPSTLQSSFRKSPICSSYAEFFVQNNDAHFDRPFPPGVRMLSGGGDYFCCGACAFTMPVATVLHFKTASYDGCSVPNRTVTTPKSNPGYYPGKGAWGPGASRLSHRKRDAASPGHSGKHAVVDGSTLTYPSVYMVVPGGVTVRNMCGVVGKIHTSPTIAIPPGDLSSLSFSSDIFAMRGYDVYPYDPGLPTSCRTYGFNTSISSWFGTDGLTTTPHWMSRTATFVGPPYSPILSPPQQLIDLDPAWKNCQNWNSMGGLTALWYGILDPPRVLEIEGVDDEAPSRPAGPTTANDPTQTGDTLPYPGGMVSPDQPKPTNQKEPKASHTSDPGDRDHKPGYHLVDPTEIYPTKSQASGKPSANSVPPTISIADEGHSVKQPDSKSLAKSPPYDQQASKPVSAALPQPSIAASAETVPPNPASERYRNKSFQNQASPPVSVAIPQPSAAASATTTQPNLGSALQEDKSLDQQASPPVSMAFPLPSPSASQEITQQNPFSKGRQDESDQPLQFSLLQPGSAFSSLQNGEAVVPSEPAEPSQVNKISTFIVNTDTGGRTVNRADGPVTLSLKGSVVEINGATLRAGESGIVVSGIPISLDPSKGLLIQSYQHSEASPATGGSDVVTASPVSAGLVTGLRGLTASPATGGSGDSDVVTASGDENGSGAQTLVIIESILTSILINSTSSQAASSDTASGSSTSGSGDGGMTLPDPTSTAATASASTKSAGSRVTDGPRLKLLIWLEILMMVLMKKLVIME